MKLIASNPGLAGGLIGLILGLFEYVIAMVMIRRYAIVEIETAKKEKEVLPGMSILPGTLRMLRMILIVAAVVIYPVVGYVVGSMIAT